jgi:diguanylate cyclase (GGDEF)-like protein
VGGKQPQLENANLKTYALLARLGFPKSYRAKILLVGFLGFHMPLIALVFYFLACLFLGAQASIRPAPYVLVPLLIAPLAGTIVALWVIRDLLAPINLVISSIRGYFHDRRVPELPVGFSDEAGKLMAEVQYAMEELDATIHSLEALSGTDHLTGLLNRRAAEERLAEDLARAKRNSGELVVAMVDTDRFKSINDTHGHQAGDVCIQQVAEVMRRKTRKGDWLARWGGDEFVMVMWDASVFASAEMVFGRINADLAQSPIRLPQGGELLLSVSVGACRYSGEDDIRELLSQADAAMYEAKREGRPWVLAR